MKQMMMTISKHVAEILLHRLQVLEDDVLEEVFCETPELDQALLVEAVTNFRDAFEQGSYVVAITNAEDLAIIIECVEGSTYFGARDMMSPSFLKKRVDAITHFAEQLSKASGKGVDPVLH